MICYIGIEWVLIDESLSPWDDGLDGPDGYPVHINTPNPVLHSNSTYKILFCFSGCVFNQNGMTVWEFEHFKFRAMGSNHTHSAINWTIGEESNSSRHGAPRLGVDGVKLGHLVGNQVSQYQVRSHAFKLQKV